MIAITMVNISQIARITATIAKGTQIGARTQTHDHVIILQSLRTMKAIPRSDKNGKDTVTLVLFFIVFPFWFLVFSFT